jgi:DnaJ-class molecular chaperone
MQDHYKTLGLSSAATREEIRRAYRVLARRYHPDVNPGNSTAERFREISRAYETLSDPERRKQYDSERETEESFSSAFDRAHQAYRKQQATAPKGARATPQQPSQTKQHARPQTSTRPPPEEPKPQSKPHTKPEPKIVRTTTKVRPSRVSTLRRTLEASLSRAKNILTKPSPPKQSRPTVSSIALMEVSVSIFEAIAGVRKTIEVAERDGTQKKLSISIPAGVRQGSIVRLRSKENGSEEIIIVVRVAHHPWLSISHRGLTIEVPITISEAIAGAKVQIPSLQDPLLVTIEPGTQSGKEVRLKGQGIPLPDGTRGDLFARFLIQVPPLSEAPESASKLVELESLYHGSVREHLPRSLMDGEPNS